MAVKVKRDGQYELFRSTQGEEILDLDGEQFMIVEGPKGEHMLARQGDFECEQVLARGSYRLVDNEEAVTGNPQLLLRRNGHFQVVIFPDGLPSKMGEPQRFVETGEKVGLDEVETYVQSLQSGSGGARERGPSDEEPFPELVHHLSGLKFPVERRTLIEYVHRRQGSQNVIDELKLLPERNYESLNDVQNELAELMALQDLGVEDYEEQSAEELLEMIEAMEPAELRKLEDFERRHKGRDQVIDAIERRLEG